MLVDNMMRGPAHLRTIIKQFFRDRMPAAIDVMRIQAELTEATLPYPVVYDAIDPYKGENWPFVGSYINSTDDWVQVDTLETGSPVFEGTYDLAIFVAARTASLGSQDGMALWETPERDSAIKMRDELLVIMRSLILGYPSLGTAGQEDRVVANLETIREVYAEPMVFGQTNRWIASGVINLTVNFREAVAVPIYGPLNTYELVPAIIDDTP